MRRFRSVVLLFFLFLYCALSAQIKILSWNIENLGASKSPAEIGYIAEVMAGADVVALQEVVAGPAGPAAVDRLAGEMNRHGDKWGYVISASTTGSPHRKERYAFFWRKSVVSRLGNAWLEKSLANVIDREPYCATFLYKGKKVTLVNFHATTKKNNPEKEISHLKNLPLQYRAGNLIFLGDFNLPQSHTVFNPLRKKGWVPAFTAQKTSLRQKCIDGDCLASEYDNIWYESARMKVKSARAIHFYKTFKELKSARRISDHIPIEVVLEFR